MAAALGIDLEKDYAREGSLGLSVSSAQIPERWSANKAQSLLSKTRHRSAKGSMERNGSSIPQDRTVFAERVKDFSSAKRLARANSW
jgi:hypothetical protein